MSQQITNSETRKRTLKYHDKNGNKKEQQDLRLNIKRNGVKEKLGRQEDGNSRSCSQKLKGFVACVETTQIPPLQRTIDRCIKLKKEREIATFLYMRLIKKMK